jgi:hypothetical protein
VIIEAPVPELLRHAGEHWHYRAFREMTDAYFNAFRAGQTAAIEAMIDFYGAPGPSPPGRNACAAMRSTRHR